MGASKGGITYAMMARETKCHKSSQDVTNVSKTAKMGHIIHNGHDMSLPVSTIALDKESKGTP